MRLFGFKTIPRKAPFLAKISPCPERPRLIRTTLFRCSLLSPTDFPSRTSLSKYSELRGSGRRSPEVFNLLQEEAPLLYRAVPLRSYLSRLKSFLPNNAARSFIPAARRSRPRRVRFSAGFKGTHADAGTTFAAVSGETSGLNDACSVIAERNYRIVHAWSDITISDCFTSSHQVEIYPVY